MYVVQGTILSDSGGTGRGTDGGIGVKDGKTESVKHEVVVSGYVRDVGGINIQDVDG